MNRNLLYALLSVLLFSTATAVDTTPTIGLHDNTPTRTAITNARIIVHADRAIENGTLLYEHGVIVAVGENVQIPDGTTIINAHGHTIYPGFVDPVAEYGLEIEKSDRRSRNRTPQYEAERVGAEAWNDAIHAEKDWVEYFKPDSSAADRYRSQGFVAVRTGREDGIFRGRSAVVSLSEGLPNNIIIRPHACHSLSFSKGNSPQEYPSSLMGIIALIRQMYYDVDWYQQAHRAWERNQRQPMPEFNAAIEALARDAGDPVFFHVNDDLDLLRAARLGDEFDLPLTLVGSGYEYRRAQDIVEWNLPIVLPVNFPGVPEVNTLEDELDVTLADLRHWERAPTNASELHKRGARIAFTSTGLDKKTKYLSNVREAVKAGLPPRTALEALTSVPAELCGVDRYLGTLEPGKLASFIIAEGDLFADTTDILSVWVKGNHYEFEPLSHTEFRGEYSFHLDGLSGTLSVKGKLKKPEASLIVDSDTTTAGDLSIDHNKIQFRADLGSDAPGLTRFTARLDDDLLYGTVAFPNGDWSEWTAVRRAQYAPELDTVESDDSPEDRPDSLLSKLTIPNRSYGVDQPARPENVLVRNATIWTVDEAGVIENADLLVVDGKIAGVGSNLESPDDVRIIDATGKHVTPGLIDEHSHIAISGNVNEGTDAVSSEVRIKDIIDPYDVNIYRQLSGGLTASRLLHGSANPIGGHDAVIKLRWGHDENGILFKTADQGIKFALGENVKQSGWGERFNIRYPQTRTGVEAIIRDYLLAARQYEQDWAAYNALSSSQKEETIRPRRNLRLEALREVLNNQTFITCHAYVAPEMLMMLRLAEDFGITVRSFGHGLEGYKIADELAAHGAGVGSFSDWWAYKFETYDAIPQSPGLMAERSVTVAVNSDNADLARRLNQEAAKSIMYTGMSPEEALKLVTINPAKILGVDDRVGSLTVGKDADFVIWSDNPLSIYARAEQTWVDGARYFDLATDSLLREQIQAEKQALVQKALAADGNGKNGRSSKRIGGHKPPDNHGHPWGTSSDGGDNNDN